jgi:tetratricopeptide (TPR) repeat protein
LTRVELLEALVAMLPGQFDFVVAKLNVPFAFLRGAAAPQATRAVDVVRYLESNGRLDELRAMVSAPGPVVPTAPQVSIARLPATGKDLFGREAELAWLDACWQEGVRVASVVAFGGVGKSALMNAWLARMGEDEWRGAQKVYGWSFYSQGTDRLGSSDEFIDAALRWFGDPDPTQGSPWDKGERLAALVKKERTLLLLDGVEPLQWGPGVQEGKLKDPALEALVKELGTQNKGLCLITSRIALEDLDGVRGNKVRAKDLGSLSPEAGAELLKARGAKGTDDELREAASEYKGHGLALTLLGSYLEDVAKGDILKRDEIGPLMHDERHGGHARRVMAAYESWLGPTEIAILRMIGLFDRPVDDGEIAALRKDPVVPGLTDALVDIRELSWNKAVAKLHRTRLLSTEQNSRLDAHPLVREHFGEQLKRDHLEAWREGHRRLYVHLKEKAKPLPDTLEEMAPLYAAVVHGCLAGMSGKVLDEIYWKRIKRGNVHFNSKKLGAFGSEIVVLSAFFDPPWERLAPGLSELDQAFVLSTAGFALRSLGRLSDAARLMRSSLEQGVAQEDWENAATRASNFSDVLHALGELDEARVHARTGVQLADRSGNAFLTRNFRTTLAMIQHEMGHQSKAAAKFEEAERMQQEDQPATPLLYSRGGFHYCGLLLDQGRIDEVFDRAAKSLELAIRNQQLLSIALDHLSLGCAHLISIQRGTISDLAHATSHLWQAVDGFRRAGVQEYLPRGLLARAALHTHTRDFAAARHDLDEALTLSTRCGFRLHEADAHLGYARLALAEGHLAPAREHLAKARSIIDATGYHRRDGELTTLESEAAAMAATQ